MLGNVGAESPKQPQTSEISIFEDSEWQMALGERSALEGVLSQLKPRLSIELGTAQGGSLERIASHSREVHTFDLIDPPVERERFPNVTFHVGDSHSLLRELLARLVDEGKNVDFALVDGDHSVEGVRQDIEDLLGSPSVGKTVILIHDTANEVVREGIDLVRFDAFPKVASVDLDFVCGYVFREPALRYELWGGLGLVRVDAARTAYFTPPVRQRRYYESGALLREARDRIRAAEAEAVTETS